jgi:Ca2+-binding RTX toxin-like protein
MSRIQANITADLGSAGTGRGLAGSSQSGQDVVWSIENFIGGSGDDVIIAGRAANQIDGGAGSDTYRFLSAEDANGDTILSFQPGDRVDLSQIDANGTGAGDTSFTLVSGALTGVGQLLVSHEMREDGEYTVIHGNLAGATDAEFSLSIRGHHDLTASNLTL